jgi:hypothetical protein
VTPGLIVCRAPESIGLGGHENAPLAADMHAPSRLTLAC